MGRNYSPAGVEKIIGRLRSVREDPFIACDIIAAFPGESGEDFEETRLFCERAGFSWIHAFPFSRRPGTPAYNYGGRVNEREAGRRVAALTRLAHEGRRSYLDRWKGRELEAVVEAGKKRSGAFLSAVSENYLKLLVEFDSARIGNLPTPAPGSLIRCLVREEITKDKSFDALAGFSGLVQD